MHPAPAEHAHSLRSGRLGTALLLMALTIGALGCEAGPPQAQLLRTNDTLFEASAEERQAALAVLDSLQHTVMRAAFDRLGGYAFTHRVRVMEYAPDGTVTNHRTQVRRFPPPDSARRPMVLRVDSAGTFDSGWLSSLTPRAPDSIVDRAQFVVPEEPAYLEPRTREAFRYRLRPDTALGGRTVRVVELHAQPGDLGADRVIRHARLLIDPATYELVGLYLVRADASVLFREDSRASVYLQPAPDSGWVPGTTQLEARLKVPFRAPRSFRLHASFHGYRPLS